MNHLITEKKRLLTADGKLSEAGWSKSNMLTYSPYDVCGREVTTSEWDRYFIFSENGYVFSTVIADFRAFGIYGATFYDPLSGKKRYFHKLVRTPMGNMDMPYNSETGDVFVKSKYVEMCFTCEDGERRLRGRFFKSTTNPDMEFDITVHEKDNESLFVSTPVDGKENSFSYSRDNAALACEGYVKFDGKKFNFDTGSSLASFDWNRRSSFSKKDRYWATACGKCDGHTIGLNLGYGRGDATRATENALFIDGKILKLSHALMKPSKADKMQSWDIFTNDGRFRGTFIPFLDNKYAPELRFSGWTSHQLIGRLSGDIILESGETLKAENLIAVIEKVRKQL